MNITNQKRSRANAFIKKNRNGLNRISKRRAVSTIDPQMLINKPETDIQESVDFIPSHSFKEMPIDVNLKVNLLNKGFINPTQIQEETFKHLIAGTDLIGIANTGTGKTGAFLIPIIHKLLTAPRSFQSLVVVPTRELALQVEEEFKVLSNGLGLHCASFIGGTSINKDFAQLRRKNVLIIGTPGRLLDLSNRGALKLHEISTLVLDEFDMMLDMGFKHDIMKMIEAMPGRKQTMLFSATIDKTQQSLIKKLVNNPIEVKVSSGLTTSDQVEQDIIRIQAGDDKFEIMLNMIEKDDFNRVLVFTETKHQANRVSKKLNDSGIASDQIHGNKSQSYRNNALLRFKNGNIKVLVATDVAARGIDVSDVSHVINYQLPLSFDSYIHRIGRTGRAGKPGKAYTFID